MAAGYSPIAGKRGNNNERRAATQANRQPAHRQIDPARQNLTECLMWLSRALDELTVDGVETATLRSPARTNRCGAKDAMRRVAVLLMALTLAGCLPDRAKDMAACQSEASRFYQTYHAISPDDPSSRFIIGCMAAKGYDFTIAPAACNNDRPLPNQAACYTPSNWLFWAADRFRAE